MKQTIIYALDFDGVICDSALEVGISGWKAALCLWNDLTTASPPQQLIDDFLQIRPLMTTGYEAILINKLLHDGETVASISQDFEAKKKTLMQHANLNIEALKKLYGITRDGWITRHRADWLDKSPLFSGMTEKLHHLTQQGLWYIITTKQERFVQQILNAHQVQIPKAMILGLEQNISKPDILIKLLKKHPNQTFYFVEDMLSTLLKVKNNSQLQSVKLFLASWGYNTSQDRHNAKNAGIEVVDFAHFLTP